MPERWRSRSIHANPITSHSGPAMHTWKTRLMLQHGQTTHCTRADRTKALVTCRTHASPDSAQ
eukprot:6890610-Alexandrium_andersonii.AAC.1